MIKKCINNKYQNLRKIIFLKIPIATLQTLFCPEVQSIGTSYCYGQSPPENSSVNQRLWSDSRTSCDSSRSDPEGQTYCLGKIQEKDQPNPQAKKLFFACSNPTCPEF